MSKVMKLVIAGAMIVGSTSLALAQSGWKGEDPGNSLNTHDFAAKYPPFSPYYGPSAGWRPGVRGYAPAPDYYYYRRDYTGRYPR